VTLLHAFAIPVVRLILTDSEEKVLLLRRTRCRYYEGWWCLPGGKVEYGQSVQGVIRKELREETNLTLSSSRFLFFQDCLPVNDGDLHCIDLYFKCEWSGLVRLNSESSEFVWADRSEIGNYNLAFGNDEALRRYCAR